MFYSTGPKGNLRKIDIFHTKLMSFLFPVTNTLAWTNIPALYRIRTLLVRNILVSRAHSSYLGSQVYGWLGQ